MTTPDLTKNKSLCEALISELERINPELSCESKNKKPAYSRPLQHIGKSERCATFQIADK